MAITHAKVSEKVDSEDTTLILPSDWNADHLGDSGHVIQDETTPMTARANLSFTGAGVAVTDDSGNNKTVVTIPGGGGDFLVMQVFS